MLAIKLQRIGKKHQPSYRIVVAERRTKMAAPPVEDLGSYNPFSKAFTLNRERVAHWIKMGAKPTLTVHNFLLSKEVISGKKMAVKMKKIEKPAEVAAVPAKAETTDSSGAPQAEKPETATEEEGTVMEAKTEATLEGEPVETAT
jgi:small subunit ribosomal protein S16